MKFPATATRRSNGNCALAKGLLAAVAMTIGLAGAYGQETALVFEGVNVVPMDEERVHENHTVVIERGRIVELAPAGEANVPEDANVVEATGQYLMPGLAEMHAHMPGGGPENDQYREDVAFLYLANGVTLARSMLGAPVHLAQREQLASGAMVGPRLVSAGPGFSGGVETPAEAIQQVREQAEAGYDLLKIFWGLDRETFDAMVKAAKANNMEISGHVPAAAGVPHALQYYTTIDHFDAYMPTLVDPEETADVNGGFFGYRLAPYAKQDRIEAIAKHTRDAGVWNVPTETIMYSAFEVDLDTVADERPEFQYMPPDVVEGWFDWVTNFRAGEDYDQEAGDAFLEVRLDLIATLHDVGAGLLLGSDAPQWFNVPGFSVHREMAVMEDAGLTPYEVLKTGTVNPAKYLGEEDVFGRVAKGMKADLVLVNGNPLEDLSNAHDIAGVVRHGRWHSRADLDARLEEIAERYAN